MEGGSANSEESEKLSAVACPLHVRYACAVCRRFARDMRVYAQTWRRKHLGVEMSRRDDAFSRVLDPGLD